METICVSVLQVKPLYQTRESTLVPLCLHPVQFLQKTKPLLWFSIKRCKGLFTYYFPPLYAPTEGFIIPTFCSPSEDFEVDEDRLGSRYTPTSIYLFVYNSMTRLIATSMKNSAAQGASRDTNNK